jgi:hypothetical protein
VNAKAIDEVQKSRVWIAGRGKSSVSVAERKAYVHLDIVNTAIEDTPKNL